MAIDTPSAVYVEPGLLAFLGMASRTGHGAMCACENKMRIVVRRQTERRGMPTFHDMAIVTAVVVRRTRKLRIVRVLVAIGTICEL